MAEVKPEASQSSWSAQRSEESRSAEGPRSRSLQGCSRRRGNADLGRQQVAGGIPGRVGSLVGLQLGWAARLAPC